VLDSGDLVDILRTDEGGNSIESRSLVRKKISMCAKFRKGMYKSSKCKALPMHDGSRVT